MLSTVAIMVLVALGAFWLARALATRVASAPTNGRNEPPGALDRSDFRSPSADWLIAVFTSATCSSCAAVMAELRGHESGAVVVEEVEVGASADIHRKYRIDSVPTAVVVDDSGTTHLAIVGPLGPDHRAALAATINPLPNG